ncbi:MAG TPA: hypothetical protein VHQ90_03395 [Thermoanaerobaculia bacterium]|nr:hypothetical protein [Thermoanaerobaculia bacterium]
MGGESAEGKRVGAEGARRAEGEERRLRRRGEREVGVALSEKGLIWELLVAYDRAYFGAVMPLPVGRETIRGAARELGLGLEDFTKARADYEALQERPPSVWDETTAQGVVETFAWLRTQTAKMERLLGVRSPPEVLGGLGAAERADDSVGGGRAASPAAEEGRALGGRGGWVAAESAAERGARLLTLERRQDHPEAGARTVEGGGAAWATVLAQGDERLGELIAACTRRLDAYRKSRHLDGDGGGRRELAALTEAGLALESLELDLRHGFETLLREEGRAGLALAAAERAAERLPGETCLQAFAELALRVSNLEACREAIEPRLARLECVRLARRAEQLEECLRHDPHRLEDYRRLHERRLGIERSYGLTEEQVEGGGRHRAAGASGAAGGLDGARRALAAAQAAVLESGSRSAVADCSRALASHERIASAQREAALGAELRRRRGELRAAGREFERAGGAGSGARDAAERWRRALAGYERAQTEVALTMRTPRAAEPEGRHTRLDRPLARLLRGDLTPENLARLHREVALAVRAASGRMPAPATPGFAGRRSPGASLADVAEVAGGWRRSQAALLAGARAVWRERGLEGDRAVPAAALEHLRAAVGDHQAWALAAHRLSAGGGGQGWRRVLPVAVFLQDPRLAGTPEVAVAAWLAHAVRQGMAPRAAREALLRGSGLRTATPPALSTRFVGIAAEAVRRWTMQMVVARGWAPALEM